MKGFMKIYNNGSICDCKIMKFQMFSWRCSIYEMVYFGVFLGPNPPPKYGEILLKFAPELIFKQNKKSGWKIFQKLKFLQKIERPQSLHFFQFLSNFDLLFHREGGRNRRNWIVFRTKLRHWAIRISQNQGPILPHIFRKNVVKG